MNNKNLIAVPVILIVALVATFVVIGVQEMRKQRQQVFHEVKHENDTTTHWRDKYNTEHANNIALQENLHTAQALHEQALAEVADRLQIRQKQVEGLQKMVATAKGRIVTIVDSSRRGDTTASFIAQDPFTTISGATVGNHEEVAYSVRVPIVLTPYWKRPYKFLGLEFGRIEHYIDGYSTNPSVVLDSLQDIRILSKQPGRWGAGPFVGLMYNGNNFAPVLGLGITYTLIRW